VKCDNTSADDSSKPASSLHAQAEMSSLSLSKHTRRLVILCVILVSLVNVVISSTVAQKAFAAKTNVQGYWEYKGLLGMEFTIAFSPDGTTSDHPFGLWGRDAHYEVMEDRIFITDFWGVHAYALEVQGSVMTFTEKNGNVLLFHRIAGSTY